MSTKKDKFNSNDTIFMRLALNLARSRRGLTGQNPSVGCVIVKENKIISIGQTNYGGRPHAEFNAINNSIENLEGSKMYVSLEPCSHYGKTPPCTNLIIKKGIGEVFYPINDIDKKVKGKTFNILKKNNIKVFKGILKDEAKILYHPYTINRKNEMPYVTGKIAITKNKLLYIKGTKRITDKISDTLTHFLRLKNDGIMISGKTLNIDNPKLNCRLKGYERFSPKRIILDKNLEIKFTTYIFKTANKKNTIIFHNSSDNFKINILKKKGIQLIKFNFVNNNSINLKKILKKIYKLGVRNLLVEGGDRITKSFIKYRLFNLFYLFKSTKIGSIKNKHIIFTSQNLLDIKYKLISKKNSKLFKDYIKVYKR